MNDVTFDLREIYNVKGCIKKLKNNYHVKVSGDYITIQSLRVEQIEDFFHTIKDFLLPIKLLSLEEQLEKTFNDKKIGRLLNEFRITVEKNEALNKELILIEERNFIHNLFSGMTNIYLSNYTNHKDSSLEIEVGDIVECNLGMNYKKEMSGTCVQGLVCNILEDLVYIIPIQDEKEFPGVEKLYFSEKNNDVSFKYLELEDGVLIVDLAKYIDKDRVLEVVGKASSTLVEKALLTLRKRFSFINTQNVKPPQKEKFYNQTDKELLSIIKGGLEFVESLSEESSRLSIFLDYIGFDNDIIIRKSFFVANEIQKAKSKYTYREISKKVVQESPLEELDTDSVKKHLQEAWKEWKNRRGLKLSSSITILTLFKIFNNYYL